jgi:hypothetical protein
MEAYDHTTTKLQKKVRDQSRDKKTKTTKWEQVAHFYNRGARYYSWVNQSAVIRERTAASLKQRHKTNNKVKAPQKHPEETSAWPKEKEADRLTDLAPADPALTGRGAFVNIDHKSQLL